MVATDHAKPEIVAAIGWFCTQGTILVVNVKQNKLNLHFRHQ